MSSGQIPFKSAVFGSLGLVLRNLGPIVRIAWLPLLLSSVVAAWPFTRFPNRDLGGLDADELATTFLTFDAFSFLAMMMSAVFMTMALTGLLRYFLREEKPRLPFYLHWGKDEWRVTGGVLAGMLVTLVALAAFSIVAMLASVVLFLIAAGFGIAPALADLANLDVTGDSDGSLFMSIASVWIVFVVVAFAGVVFWISARMTFFYVGPVAEGKLELGRFFRLTKGHAGRLVGIFVWWGLIVYGGVIAITVVIDLFVVQGVLLDYWRLVFYLELVGIVPDSGPLPFDPWSQMPRLLVGAVLANLLIKIPAVVIAPLYALTFLHRLEMEDHG